MILATYTKQPVEELDYDIDYTDWLATGDAIDTATATVTPAGLVVLDPMPIAGDIVKVWASEGVHGTTYKVEVTMTTTGGRVRQDEIRFKVREI